MGYVLGIDLGTTYSAAAVCEGGRAEIVQLGTRQATIPSVVLLRSDGEVLVGEAAERRALAEPARVAREFKRRLGDPTPLILGGTPYGAEALMAQLLRWVVAAVTEQKGAAPDVVAITHPAGYGPYKLDLLQQAARQADIRSVVFLTEPEAAAVHYAEQERVPAGAAIAVYDFGGGTFDAAVVRRTDEGWDLLGEGEGIERLGGIDFDEAVFAHVRESLAGEIEELSADLPAAATAVRRLRADCTQAKESLSEDTEATIPVLLPSVQTEVRLTRAEFEAIARPRIRETITALERAVRSAGLTMDDVDRVLLVGGSSRIPLVAQLVREVTGRPVAIDAQPKHAIALGAAAMAARQQVAPALPPAPGPAPRPAAGAGTAPGTADIPASPPQAPAPARDATDAPDPVEGAGGETAAPGDHRAEQPRAASTPAGRGGLRLPRVALVGLPVAAVVVAVVVFLALRGGGGDGAGAGATATETARAGATEIATGNATRTAAAGGSTTAAATATPTTAAPTATTAPPQSAAITGVSIVGGRYSVSYTWRGFTPNIRDVHVHFFFNTVAPAQAGIPGQGPWIIYDTPSPFTGYTVAERPSGATEMCILVANPDHSVRPGTGNCWALPQ